MKVICGSLGAEEVNLVCPITCVEEQGTDALEGGKELLARAHKFSAAMRTQ